MPVTSLIIVGAGGFAREAAEVVHAINERRPTWELLGFVDDDRALHGGTVDGLPVLGPVASAADASDAMFVVCTGHPGNYFSRRRIVERLGFAAARYATLVHPAAVVPKSADIGVGSVLLATVVVTSTVRVGAHVAMMPGVVLTHDDVIGDYATFGSGARLAGRVTVGEGAYIGAGALVREERSVGLWSLVGMGAVVTTDVPAAEVWAGVPARRLRAVDLPADLSAGAVSAA
jgi:sugar O-acyltransferase (sialic acid O-acetyltransferase NeuD family)